MADASAAAPPLDPGIAAVLAASEGGALKRFVCHLGLNDATAEDCAQEALVRLFTQLDEGRRIEQPKAWTYRVAYRLAMDHHREARRVAPLPDVDHGADLVAPDPTDRLDASDAVEALGRLPSRRRQVLHLRYLAGLPFRDVAATLGITSSAARSHATQGMHGLRRELGLTRSGLASLEPSGPPSATVGPARAITGLPASGFRTAVRPDLWVEPIGVLQRPPGGLIEPAGVDVDGGGRIWVIDTGHGSIAIFSPDGAFLERWGEPGSTPGRFSFRRALGNQGDIRFAPDGGFYIADNGNHRIQRFDRDRRLVACWGTIGRGPGQFLDPWSVRLDRDEVFISDAIRDDVQVFSPSGRHLRTIGRAGSGPGQLDFQGDAVMADGRLHVADHANSRISVFHRDGRFIRQLGLGLLDGPDGLDIGPGGDLYVGETLARRFTILDSSGAIRATWPGEAWTLRVLPDGRVLTSGRAGVTIHRVTAVAVEPRALSISASIAS